MRLSTVNNDAVRRMFKAGQNYREIAEALGTTKGVIAGKCARLGLVRNPDRAGRTKKADPAERERDEFARDNRDLLILRALDNGASQQTCARRFGVSQSYICELAKATREAA